MTTVGGVVAVSLNEKDPSKLAHAIRQLSEGRSNATGTFTLNANSTSTTVTAVNCGPASTVLWSATTTAAAAALGSLFCASASSGKFVLTHASNASTAQTFKFSIAG